MLHPRLGVPAAALTLLATGCAIGDAANRRLVGALDSAMIPPSTEGKVALAVVALPVSVTALALDAVVVHPASVVDDAWGDTVEFLWRREDETPLRKALFSPLAAVATPFVFTGDWLGRSLFAIPSREVEEAKVEAGDEAQEPS